MIECCLGLLFWSDGQDGVDMKGMHCGVRGGRDPCCHLSVWHVVFRLCSIFVPQLCPALMSTRHLRSHEGNLLMLAKTLMLLMLPMSKMS